MASPTQSEYHTGRVATQCTATGRSFEPGDSFIGALVEIEGEPELVRQDFTIEAWEQGARPRGLFAFWKGVVPSEERPAKPSLDPGSAMDLFDQLESAEEPRRIAFRYLLALMMMRKRLLTLEKSASGRLFVRRKGDDPELPAIEVAEPTIDQKAIGELSPLVAELVGIEA